MGRRNFVLRAFGEYRIRPREVDALELTDEQRRDAAHVATTFRAGLAWNSPDLVALAGALDAALDGRTQGVVHGYEPSLAERERHDALAARIQRALADGRLVVERTDLPSLTERLDPLPDGPFSAPPRSLPGKLFFEVRFVDEIGQALGGLPVVFSLGGDTEDVSTNAAGVALLENATPTTAAVSVTDLDALAAMLDQRWQKLRAGTPTKQGNTFETVFDGDEVGSFDLRAASPHTVIIKPPRGNIMLSLRDKHGRAAHANRPYTLAGPEPLSGTTDEQGQLLHEQVFPGDYTLTLDVEVETDPPEHDTFAIPVVVQPAQAEAQLRMVGITGAPALVRLKGLVFDRNKTFVKPSAVVAFQRIRELYESYDPGALLIVGHTDTTGEPAVNDPLSLARAKSVEAFLEDDVDTWLRNYDQDGAGTWGGREDRLMLGAMPDLNLAALGPEPDLGPDPTPGDAPDADLVRWFQRTRGLEMDGVAGPQTRRQLVTEYMALDGTTLTGNEDFDIEVTTHGCGENFPLADDGELDPRPAAERDNESDVHDRRVELFFFEGELGIVPAPSGDNSGPGSSDYPTWLERSTLIQDFDADAAVTERTLLELEDALFRTNSAVLMPEGEKPSSDSHGSITSVGILAKTLRFNADKPPKKLLVAGHTDTEGSAAFNRPLSHERAELTYTLLLGKRDRFVQLADARHVVSDQKQILSWCSVAHPEIFACDPGDIDDDAASGAEAVRDFQAEYNAAKAALGADDQADLAVDGVVGPATWGAIFDVYEQGLRDELGVDADGLADLRGLLRFLADDLAFVGFGESHPIEEPTRDQFRSQTNRRVEILFFDPGAEPDLGRLRNDPEHSELYDPEIYTPVAVELDFPVSDFVFSPLQVYLLDEARKRMGADSTSTDPVAQNAGAPYRLVLPSGEVRTGYADKDGLLTENDVPDFESCKIQWGVRDVNDGVETESSGDRPDDATSSFGLPQSDEDADGFFTYSGSLIIHGSRGKGRILELLSNLGHEGAEDERRAQFAKFYRASDNGSINVVHGTGKPAPTS